MMHAPRSREQGFVLIAAIWLLVLAGSIASLLMLNSLGRAQQARAEGDILKARLALDAALETIIADRIMNGDRSIWSRAPAQGSIDVDGMTIQVRATSETDRIDIVRADPRVIDAALRGAGLSAQERAQILGRIALWRGSRRATSLADIEAVLDGGSTAHDGACGADLFTAAAGGRVSELPSGVPGQITLGSAHTQTEPLRAEALQRIELQAPAGQARTTVLRVLGQRNNASSTLDWLGYRLCPASNILRVSRSFNGSRQTQR